MLGVDPAHSKYNVGILRDTIKDIYNSSPNCIQEICRRAQNVRMRYGNSFRGTYDQLKKTQYWSKKRLEKYQLMILRKTLCYAYDNVLYYKKTFDNHNINPKEIKKFSHLNKIPLLTKNDVRNNLNVLIARNIPRLRLKMVTTGGTTGIPLPLFYLKGYDNSVEWAFITSLWHRVGYTFRDKSIVLRGKIPHNGIFQYDQANHQLILSSFNLTPKNMRLYCDLIRKFNPKFIQAYPSSIFILAKFMEEKNIDPFPTVKALLLASESVYTFQRIKLEQVFKCRVFSWYGHTERAILAGECEVSSDYHIFPEYGYTEIIGKDGELITETDESGEIVATGFTNPAMPLIRYRTGDIGIISLGKKCKCGRNYSLLERVEGRLQEFLIAKDGRLMPLTVLFAIHDPEWLNIKKIQYIQEVPGELIIKVVKAPYSSTEDVTSLVSRVLRARLGESFKFTITFVENISRTKRGKYRYLLQKLPIAF